MRHAVRFGAIFVKKARRWCFLIFISVFTADCKSASATAILWIIRFTRKIADRVVNVIFRRLGRFYGAVGSLCSCSRYNRNIFLLSDWLIQAQAGTNEERGTNSIKVHCRYPKEIPHVFPPGENG